MIARAPHEPTSPQLIVRQLRDFAIGAIVAIVIATCAFVAVRNRELIERQLDRAARAADAVAADHTPLPDVHAVLVTAAEPSPRHAFLGRRNILERSGGLE